MASTSDQEGRLLFASGAFADYFPQDTLHTRILLNNAQHFSDMDGQVRVCTSGFTLDTGTLSSTTSWFPITTYGPFPLRLDADGAPFPLRVRMAGSASQAVSVSLRACVSALRTNRRDMIGASANVLDVATSSTTGAWLTATTAASGTTILSLSAAQADDARTRLATLDAISGNPDDVMATLVVCKVWGKTTNVSARPQLNGLYLAELA